MKQKHTHPQSTVDEATDYYFFDYLIHQNQNNKCLSQLARAQKTILFNLTDSPKTSYLVSLLTNPPEILCLCDYSHNDESTDFNDQLIFFVIFNLQSICWFHLLRPEMCVCGFSLSFMTVDEECLGFGLLVGQKKPSKKNISLSSEFFD